MSSTSTASSSPAWRVDGREDLTGLKAFRRAYPAGETVVVASDVERPFERELLPGIGVEFAGLEYMIRRLTGA